MKWTLVVTESFPPQEAELVEKTWKIFQNLEDRIASYPVILVMVVTHRGLSISVTVKRTYLLAARKGRDQARNQETTGQFPPATPRNFQKHISLLGSLLRKKDGCGPGSDPSIGQDTRVHDLATGLARPSWTRMGPIEMHVLLKGQLIGILLSCPDEINE